MNEYYEEMWSKTIENCLVPSSIDGDFELSFNKLLYKPVLEVKFEAKLPGSNKKTLRTVKMELKKDFAEQIRSSILGWLDFPPLQHEECFTIKRSGDGYIRINSQNCEADIRRGCDREPTVIALYTDYQSEDQMENYVHVFLDSPEVRELDEVEEVDDDGERRVSYQFYYGHWHNLRVFYHKS